MIELKPDRETWKSFCTQPELSDVEEAEWNEMAAYIKSSDDAFSYIESCTVVEFDNLRETESSRTPCWQDVVDSADARRVLARAELEAWRELKVSDNEATPIEREQECRNLHCAKKWKESTTRAFCPFCGCSMVRARDYYEVPF